MVARDSNAGGSCLSSLRALAHELIDSGLLRTIQLDQVLPAYDGGTKLFCVWRHPWYYMQMSLVGSPRMRENFVVLSVRGSLRGLLIVTVRVWQQHQRLGGVILSSDVRFLSLHF